MPIVRIPLSATEDAFVLMVQEEHAALIRMADQKRNARLAPLLADKAIPPRALVSREAGEPSHLTYEDRSDDSVTPRDGWGRQ